MDAPFFNPQQKSGKRPKKSRSSLRVANKSMANAEDMANKIRGLGEERTDSRNAELIVGTLGGKAEEVEAPPLTYRYRDAEKRREYQREYMRKKRAAIRTR